MWLCAENNILRCEVRDNTNFHTTIILYVGVIFKDSGYTHTFLYNAV